MDNKPKEGGKVKKALRFHLLLFGMEELAVIPFPTPQPGSSFSAALGFPTHGIFSKSQPLNP